MSIYATDSNGNVKKVIQIFHNDGTSIKEIKEMYTNYNGTIQKVFSKNNRQYNNVNYIVKIYGQEDIDITNNKHSLSNICSANEGEGNCNVVIESDFIIKNNDIITIQSKFNMDVEENGTGSSKVKIKLFIGDYTYNSDGDIINDNITEEKIIIENEGNLINGNNVTLSSNNVTVSNINDINDKKLKIFISIEDPADRSANYSNLVDLTIIINDQIIFEY